MQVWNVLHASSWKWDAKMTQKWRKKSPSAHHRTTLSGCIFATQGMYRQSEKLIKQQYVIHMSHNMANFGLLTAEICSGVWGTPATFNGFRVLPSLLQRRRSLEASQTLHDVWSSPVLVHYIYIFGGCCPWQNFARCKIHFTSKSCARHSRNGRQPNVVAWYKEWNYGTFTEGATCIRQGVHHVEHRPTF